LQVSGRVQGVGFRPFVYRLARQMGLGGRVGNDSHGAFIEIEGATGTVARFRERLTDELPPLASISEVRIEPLEPTGEQTFHIEESEDDGTQDAEITPDTALCGDCRRELFDPADRRYRYPFINCTNCGPRYSIIHSVPYDRPGTTMARFTMCPACQAEYDDPANRRFHAQPNACPACGPQVWLTDAKGTVLADRTAGPPRPSAPPTDAREDPVRMTAALIRAGRIVAIKGLGGFHLACRADDHEVVARLRTRKARESKPLALMVADLATARSLATIDEATAAALLDITRPIVLAPRKESPLVCPQVAPGTDLLGIMLPYTPLHEILFAEGLGPLVMTSGNPSEEPLCADNAEALARLGSIADAFLLHDRDIERRVDDSVVLAASGRDPAAPAALLPLRRARGFAPAPIRVPVEASRPVLALGAELKSTICVLAGTTAIVSEHLGELANAKAYRNFAATLDRFQRLLRVRPAVLACDLHPEYAATRYAHALAREHALDLVDVQHHHAHMASVMAEHGLAGRALGICCDGTGFGTDGTIWGCELLVGDAAGFTRAGHLRCFRLPGGDAAARETWRPALSLLHDCFGPDAPEIDAAMAGRVPAAALEMTSRRLQGTGRLPLTSSLGRLFDAVAFLLGLATDNRHEAEAAMALEAAARTCPGAEPLTFDLSGGEDGPGDPLQLDVRPTLRDLLAGTLRGENPGKLARAFHETLAAGLAAAAVRIAGSAGLDRVALSGGCFANRLLLDSLVRRLETAGLNAVAHHRVPTGDGGVSLGQAVVAAAVAGE
jgi:hydrogenase maturation protein HypF